MEPNTAHSILGLRPGASLKELDEAYQDMLALWQPDRLGSNPRLRAKANIKLEEIRAAHECLMELLSGAGPGPGESAKPPQTGETATKESGELGEPIRRTSLYDDAIATRRKEKKPLIPVLGAVFALFALILAVSYFLGSGPQPEAPITQPDSSPPPGETSPEIAGLAEEAEREGAGAEPAVPPDPPLEPAQAGQTPIPALSPRFPSQQEVKQSSAPPGTQETPGRNEQLKAGSQPSPPPSGETTRVPEESPVLVRDEILSPGEGSSQDRELKEAEKEAFDQLKFESAAARELLAGLLDELEYQDWKVVKQTDQEVWIDLLARRKSDGQELHFIWTVDRASGQVRALSQAARDLDTGRL